MFMSYRIILLFSLFSINLFSSPLSLSIDSFQFKVLAESDYLRQGISISEHAPHLQSFALTTFNPGIFIELNASNLVTPNSFMVDGHDLEAQLAGGYRHTFNAIKSSLSGNLRVYHSLYSRLRRSMEAGLLFDFQSYLLSFNYMPKYFGLRSSSFNIALQKKFSLPQNLFLTPLLEYNLFAKNLEVGFNDYFHWQCAFGKEFTYSNLQAEARITYSDTNRQFAPIEHYAQDQSLAAALLIAF